MEVTAGSLVRGLVLSVVSPAGLHHHVKADGHSQLCYTENWYSYSEPAKLKIQVFSWTKLWVCLLLGAARDL